MDTATLVEESFENVILNKDKFVQQFYTDLFKMAPSVEPMFKNTTKERQGEKLYNSLVILVENIRNPEAIKEILEPLGQDHVGYGTQLVHYPVVGQCLINTISELNGDHWSPNHEKAWLDTYQTVVELMTEN
ncbi:MAG: globin domain-containing protein [Flavobacteriaceae bacterium]